MTSNPGAKTCGAFRRSMANTSPGWRTCLISMPKRPISSGRSFASTKVRCNSSARSVSQSRPGRAGSNVTITSIVAMGRSISSFSSTCIVPGAKSNSRSGERQKTMPNAYATSLTSIIPMPRPSGLCRITYRPTPPAPCIRRSRPPKPGGSCGGSSSTTPPSTQAGSTWLRSRSASCGDSASLAGSTTPSDCAAKSPLGNDREMPHAPASNGCSRQKRPAPKWGEPTQTLPMSHNHCAEVLVALTYSCSLLTDGVRIEATRRRLLRSVEVAVSDWVDEPGASSVAARVLMAAVGGQDARADEKFVLLSHQYAAKVPASIADQLNMPALSLLSVTLTFDGRVDTPDGTIRARWFDERTRSVWAKRVGAFVEVGNQTSRLSSALFELMEAIDGFNE